MIPILIFGGAILVGCLYAVWKVNKDLSYKRDDDDVV
jgi:hypothetical protein